MNTTSTRLLDATLQQSLFFSIFIGGFECSTHRRLDGKRLDLIEGTQHDRFVREDYQRMRNIGMTTAREGLRWHRIETSPGVFDWSEVLPFFEAAREFGITVIWDLLHFGWPEHVDVWDESFASRLAAFAREFAQILVEQKIDTPYIAPINEISFLSLASGQAGFFFPFGHGRGDEFKAQMVRGVLASCDAMWEINASTRFFHIEPIINIDAQRTRPQDRGVAEGHRQSQFQVWDMICGRMKPELGGDPKYLDVLGANYYSANQWIHNGETMGPSHPQYVPLRYMLNEIFERYGRPIFVSETGIEDDARPDWIRYICQEVRGAQKLGLPLHGITLYPVLNHPGWDNDRHCYNGLWDYADANGHREIYEPLWREMQHQAELFERAQNEAEVGEEAIQVEGITAVAQHIAELDAEARHD